MGLSLVGLVAAMLVQLPRPGKGLPVALSVL